MSEKKVFQDQSEMNVIFVHSSLDDAGLSVYAFRVYCHIARRANRTGSAFPGIQSIGTVCGISESQVRRAIKELEDRHFMEVRRTTGGTKSNVYFLTPPSSWNPCLTDTPVSQEPDPCLTDTPPLSDRHPKVIHEGNPDKEIPISDKSEDVKIDEPKTKMNPVSQELHSRIHSWFNRRPSTKWSKKELTALKILAMSYADCDQSDLNEDLDILEWYYTKTQCEYLRREPVTLMNNWPAEIDKAKVYRED
jgi:DNA-binding MarR family transcriptional regulator